MTGSPRRLAARTLLRENWQICAAPPVEPTAPPSDGAAPWTAIPDLMPVAAALRQLGQWSLDGPATAFDAQDWWYRLGFDAPAGWTEGTLLGFDGLATCAEVWLNGTLLLTSDNMFVAHQCEVGQLLRAQGNELAIRFKALDSLLLQRRARPKWRTPMVAHQQLRWWRTTLLGRTPGWSPPAAVVGPWKDIWLEQRSAAAGQLLRLRSTVEGTTGIVSCEFDPGAGSHAAPAAVDLRLEREGRVEVQSLTRNAATGRFEGQLRLRDAQLWWPHTHGEPALYRASLALRADGAAQEIVEAAGHIGFRTIAVDSAAGAFSLSVNGVPVFCRGACWTPLDPVSLRSTSQACLAAVAQAREAGMNMLRVPGTGVYEEDHFYDACDQHGLLVWQDFMFANMDYPADDPAFHASVLLEARQQLQRLAGRPCLAVLCGNSEAQQQAAMWGAPREQWAGALFEDTLPRLCTELAPGTPYWPSSAHGGAFPHQADTGTTSYYGVGAYLRPLDDARRSGLRFATECLAFANIPQASALARMPGGLATRAHHPGWKERSPRDLGAGWDFDDVRDHYLAQLFHVDPVRLRASDHDRYLALGRLATGEAMAASFSEWRRPASACSGALVLMLRDLWAGAGWGLVDDAGVPKACYHYLRRVLQPLAVFVSDEGVNGLFVHVVNEGSQERSLELELAAWRGGEIQVAAGKKTLAVPARGGCSLSAVELLDHFMDLGWAYRFGPLPCEAVVATLRDAGGHRLAQAFHFPGGLGMAPEADIGLAAQLATPADEHGALLTVRTGRLAVGVHIDMPGCDPEDNYFHLPPGGQARVRLRPAPGHALAGFVHAVNSARSARVEHTVPGSSDREKAN